MSVYLVTWEINKGKSNYSEIRERFIALVQRYDHIKDADLDSVVFLSNISTANQVSDDLRVTLDGDDRLIVTKMISGNYQGWLNPNVWKWINVRI